MNRAEVVEIARGWKGTPYVLGGAVKGARGGVDCVRFVRAVWCVVTAADPPPLPPWRADWSAAQQGFALLSAARTYLEPATVPGRPGDVVVFQLGPRAAHVGILAAPCVVIHAAEGVGVVEVSLGAMAANIAAVFSFPGVDD